MSALDRVVLLGVEIDALTATEALQKIRQLLAAPGSHHVMTPNSEMLVEACRNESFHDTLQESTLNLPDSTGLLWAARYTGQHLPERVTGVDTIEALCATLDAQTPVFLLGAAPGIAAKAAAVLRSCNQRLIVAGTASGVPDSAAAPSLIQEINASGAHLLLVAFGAPAQDVWIDTHLSQLHGVRVAMGVGGTFDFLAGVQKRAPKIVQRLRCEWLWRLVRQPRRIGRIVRAVVIFPFLVMRYGKNAP